MGGRQQWLADQVVLAQWKVRRVQIEEVGTMARWGEVKPKEVEQIKRREQALVRLIFRLTREIRVLKKEEEVASCELRVASGRNEAKLELGEVPTDESAGLSPDLGVLLSEGNVGNEAN